MPTPILSYRDLKVWRDAVHFAVRIHRLVRRFPRADQFRVGDQLARAVTSIASNVAEGYGRRRSLEYLRFLDIANSSRCEAETQLAICVGLELIDFRTNEELLEASQAIGRMLTGLRRSIARTRR